MSKVGLSKKNIFWKYKSFLSIKDKKLLRLYPNNPTPIVAVPDKKIWIKLEYCSFSSSVKDREVFIEYITAKELGYKGIVVASTGNMGAALASICALYKFPCYIFTPADTSEAKLNQMINFGAKVFKINGKYDQALPKAIDYANKHNLLFANLQNCRYDGYKTIAYEIFDKFGSLLPKNIIIPLGDGTTFTGAYKGFEDLFLKGLIKKIPSFIGVQAKGCSPIAMAFGENKPVKPFLNPDTIAKAIRVGNPYDGDLAIKLSKLSNGKIFSYTDEQILQAHKELLKQGINSEYASATTYCPVLFNKMDNCLLLITGSGFKN